MRKIKYNGITYQIFVNSTISETDIRVITVPQSIVLQDSIEEMLEDVGDFDFEYLQEVLKDNNSFTVS